MKYHVLKALLLILSFSIRNVFTFTLPQAFPKPNRKSALTVRETSSSSPENDKTPPISQLEAIVVNAKSLNLWGKIESKKDTYLTSMTAGLAVSLAMVPEAIAFAIVAGVSPLVGLWTTVFLGFVAAAMGGRAGICSSCSGACSVVVAALCVSHGPSYLAGTAVLAGMLQVLAGIFGLGKFIRLVPHPVMLGFVNGLAIVMLKAQLTHFKDSATGNFLSIFSPAGQATYGIAVATMTLIRYFIPKLQEKVKALRSIPPVIVAITFASVISKYLKLPVKTLADIAGAETFRGGLQIIPKLNVGGFLSPLFADPLSTIKVILPYAITMSAVGAIESLLTLQLLDGIVDDGKRGSTKKETIGQGFGNIAAGLTGGIGGCALVGQSLINVQSGGAGSRLSGMSMSVFLGLGLIGLAPALASVPVVSLAAVMLLVCQSQFSWSSLRILNKIPRLDAFVIMLVSYVTVKDDLAKAVLAGTIASALGFAWKQSTNIFASKPDSKTYELNGPLFFGSCTKFTSLFNPKDDPDSVVLDFMDCRVADHSGLEAINSICDKYGNLNKKVYLKHLSSDGQQLLEKIRSPAKLPEYQIVESNPKLDPVYAIAEEAAVYTDVPVGKTA